MKKRYSQEFGFNDAGITNRLSLVNLQESDLLLGETLQQQVIIPNINKIIDDFYAYMLSQPDMLFYLDNEKVINKLKKTQKDYLLNLGLNFNTADYFEVRLRVGLAHAKVRIPPFLYICAYQQLNTILYQCFPQHMLDDASARDVLYAFINKIIALDMSLAIETYHNAELSKLELSLRTLKLEEDQLRHKAETDLLTGLSNHAHIVSLTENLLASAKKSNEPLCVMMADLDYFKNVNDTYGHLVGDGVLREVAARLRSALRDVDEIGRYGGEEFIVVFTNTTIETAYEVAERIRMRFENNPINLQGEVISLTISLGICSMQEGDDVSSIIGRADQALYRAKDSGRNCVKISEHDVVGG